MGNNIAKSNYKWVSCYVEIANALRENKDNQEKLVFIFQEISGSKETFDQVDPFSFFAAFNRHQKWESKTQIIQKVCSELPIEAEVPEDFAGIPVVNNLKSWFRGGEESDFQYCWSLFELALDYADGKEYVDEAVLCKAFDAVLNIKNVGLAKLTMALYWIRPESFLPFDTNTMSFLRHHFDESLKESEITGSVYLPLIKKIQLHFDKPFYEISSAAYEEVKTEDGWIPSLKEYSPGFTHQQWAQMLEDKALFSDNALSVLKRILDFGGEATCAQLSEAYGESSNFYNKNASAVAQKIANKTGCPLSERKGSEKNRYWPILFLGKDAPTDVPGTFIWKLRPELESALRKINLSSIPLYANMLHRYWWLNAKPGYWTFDELDVGEREEYTAYNEEGNKRQRYKYFEEARPGDLIVGYHTFPQMEAVCLCQIEKAMDVNAPDVQDRFITIKKVAEAQNFVSHDAMKVDAILSQMECIKSPTGSLFSLKPNEFSRITELMGLSEYANTKEGQMPKTDISLNTILCGPPGTGKTYKTMAYAVAICDPSEGSPEEIYQKMSNGGYEEVAAKYKKLKAEERIEFVTFHQSYGYEEFIEGIRPVLSSDQNQDETGQIHYDIFEGAFRKFCSRADGTIEILAATSDVPFYEDNPDPAVWKIGLNIPEVPDLYKKCHDEGVIRLGWDDIPFGEYETDATITPKNRSCIQAFEEDIQPGDLFVVPGSDAKLVSVGVVVGDCEWNQNYPAVKRSRNVKWLGDFSKKEFKRLNGGKQLTPKTIYRLDRVTVIDLLRAMGKVPSTQLAKTASETKPYVFIIDEINRGNISRIFGELITLLEEAKRVGAKEEMRVKLPYSNVNFGVPSNVYVLGTMNTADRSIALMDTALRRRFDFREMMPDYDILEDVDVEGVDIAEMLKIMNKRIEYLYDREHTLGHAYLIPLKENPSIELLSGIFKNKIIPLLQEYFYDDYAKIKAVLGSAADEFIKCKERDENLFPNEENVRPATVIYEVLSTPVDPEAFMKIYQNEAGN